MASQKANSSARFSKAPRRGRILAVDYGRRRIGLALSDELGLLAQPLATLERRSRQSDLGRLRALVQKHDVGRILVGCPLRLDGTPGEMAAEAAEWAARLGKELGLPIELVDERLTSWEAEQRQAARRPRRRRPVHEIAAAVLLEEYLARRREKA
jgi:putative Holliday junction resolvase